MNEDGIFCENCGGKMEFLHEESTCGWYCKNCEWAVVTTYNDPIFDDNTIYIVSLNAANSANKTTLRTLSEILECNFIRAKKAIDSAPVQLLSGKAYEIKKTLSLLKEADIKFEIKPDFPYEF